MPKTPGYICFLHLLCVCFLHLWIDFVNTSVSYKKEKNRYGGKILSMTVYQMDVSWPVSHTMLGNDAVPELSLATSIHLPALHPRWPHTMPAVKHTVSTLGWGKSLSDNQEAPLQSCCLCGLVRVVSTWLSGPLQGCDNWFQAILTWDLCYSVHLDDY